MTGSMTLEYAIAHTEALLAQTARQFVRLHLSM